MSEDFKKFLTNMAKYKASTTKISYKNYLKYMIKCIVIDLQKNLADMIITSNESLTVAISSSSSSSSSSK